MSGHGDTPETTSNIILLKDNDLKPDGNRLPAFMERNTELIVSEWESFARTLRPSAAGMTPLALRDHVHQILAFVVSDIKSSQTSAEQKDKSHGDKRQDQPVTAAQTHAAIRLAGGFNIGQMVSEYRALRASVINLFSRSTPAFDAQDICECPSGNILSRLSRL